MTYQPLTLTFVPAPISPWVNHFLNIYELELGFDHEHGCYFVHLPEDDANHISPCMSSQEDLEEWIFENRKDLSKLGNDRIKENEETT